MLEMVVKTTSINQKERSKVSCSFERGEGDGVWTQHSDQPERVCKNFILRRCAYKEYNHLAYGQN